MLRLVLLVCLFCVSAHALFISGNKWNNLRVTWGLNIPKHFNAMPRTVSDAVKQNFKKISSCDKNAKWRGNRYVKDNDYAVVLLYDVNGYIAGIQTSIPNNQANGYPSSKIQPPFLPDGNRYTATAYFVDPSIICTRGRTAAQYAAQGTGTNLYIQETANPEASTQVPRNEADLANTKWTKGKCFFSMGMHYWYDVKENMDCGGLFPVFLLYNGGKLNAFGWAMQTGLSSSQYEHPDITVIDKFMQTVPTCLKSVKALSTMHIYLTDKYYLNFC
ncbi:uncharacterized protein LOC101846787 [Aplysia californica]|uniref:Uncharacterized protein LOC101846787 n=1 Tax=Aplysia californica TaxID=6500 RepID=A0ABM0JDB1_APLCA|nr:uncharacterized protein LOC101846787 [Aplysia californica]